MTEYSYLKNTRRVLLLAVVAVSFRAGEGKANANERYRETDVDGKKRLRTATYFACRLPFRQFDMPEMPQIGDTHGSFLDSHRCTPHSATGIGLFGNGIPSLARKRTLPRSRAPASSPAATRDNM